MKKVITLAEITILTGMLYFYIIPNWNKHTLSLSDLLILEIVTGILYDWYNKLKKTL